MRQTPHSLHSVKVTTLLLVGLLPTLVSVLLDQIGSNPSVLGSSDADQGLYSVGQGMRKDEAEGLGESGNDFNEMAFSIEKVTVTAKSRALKAEYSLELAQDLKAIHGLNAAGMNWPTSFPVRSSLKSTAKSSVPSTKLLVLVLRTTLQLLVLSTSTLTLTVAGVLRSSRVCCSKSSAMQTQSPKRLVEGRATPSSPLLMLLPL